MDETTRVLLVEDDLRLRGLLSVYLRERGFDVTEVSDGNDAVERARANEFDVVVLDVMLPGLDGFRVCRAIRPEFDGGIVLLTARRDDRDQIVGLDMGADDYVTKPVDPNVLIARIRSLLRRLGRGSRVELFPDSAVLGDVELSRRHRRATVNGEVFVVTEAEFEVLWTLVRHSGQIVSRDMLSLAARGVPYDGRDRSVDIHVSRIRRKLRAVAPAVANA
ncbi:MAG: response regulator transcription factor, partial [Myxococcota bacterium]